MKYVVLDGATPLNPITRSILDLENGIGSFQTLASRATFILGKSIPLLASYKELQGYRFLVTPDFEDMEKLLLPTFSKSEKKQYLKNLRLILEGKPIKKKYHLHPLDDNTEKNSDFPHNLKGYYSFIVQFENSNSPTKPPSVIPNRIICLLKKFKDGTIGLAYLGNHNFTYNIPPSLYKFKKPDFGK